MKFTRAKFGGLASKDHRINVTLADASCFVACPWLVMVQMSTRYFDMFSSVPCRFRLVDVARKKRLKICC